MHSERDAQTYEWDCHRKPIKSLKLSFKFYFVSVLGICWGPYLWGTQMWRLLWCSKGDSKSIYEMRWEYKNDAVLIITSFMPDCPRLLWSLYPRFGRTDRRLTKTKSSLVLKGCCVCCCYSMACKLYSVGGAGDTQWHHVARIVPCTKMHILYLSQGES